MELIIGSPVFFFQQLYVVFNFFFVRLHFADKNIGLSFKCSVGFNTTTTNNTYSGLRCFFNPSFLKKKVVDLYIFLKDIWFLLNLFELYNDFYTMGG
jgi:hypothetical protein